MPQVICSGPSASLALSGRPTATAPAFMQYSLSQNLQITTFMHYSLIHLQNSLS